MEKWKKIQQKIVDIETLEKKVAIWKMKSDQIVFTNGCFDLFHEGHAYIIAEAAAKGHRLIVGLNSDASVRLLKGAHRPINNEQSRAKVLASLLYVDAVVLFDEETPLSLIKILNPDVLVKGGDYKVENIVGADEVLSQGGKVEIIPLIKGESSSNMIEKIRNSDADKS